MGGRLGLRPAPIQSSVALIKTHRQHIGGLAAYFRMAKRCVAIVDSQDQTIAERQRRANLRTIGEHLAEHVVAIARSSDNMDCWWRREHPNNG